MTQAKNILLKYSSKELQYVFGGSKILVHYYAETLTDNVKNRYVITCNIRGIEAASPEMEVCRVQAWDNNRETLLAEAIAELCGLEWNGICETELPKETPEEIDFIAKGGEHALSDNR